MDEKKTAGFPAAARCQEPNHPNHIRCAEFPIHEKERGDMKHFNLDHLSFRHFQIFLAAARYENFSYAASHLNVTQPLVSRSIATLEEELGFALFYRDKHKVNLTPGGKFLMDEWSKLFCSVEESVIRAQAVQAGKHNLITIADDRGTDKNKYLFPILSRYISLHPELELNIEQTDAASAIAGVYNGSIDAAFTMLHETAGMDSSVVDWKLIKPCPHMAYVHRLSPLFKRESISVQDLKNQPIVLLSAASHNYYTTAITNYLLQNNVEPTVGTYVSNNSSLLFSLRQGKGIVITNELMAVSDAENIKAFPLEGSAGGLVIFWRKNEKRKRVLSFVKTAEAFFETNDTLC
jgi:DNA-binding transcriptional LysR family regulator